jgi:hypothetical protein
MIEDIVRQKDLVNISNYNTFWEEEVAMAIEKVYVSAPAFKSAFQSNSTIVLNKTKKQMGKVLPIDLKETLNAFYTRLVPQFSPDDGPKTVSA